MAMVAPLAASPKNRVITCGTLNCAPRRRIFQNPAIRLGLRGARQGRQR
ncbi:MAG: hypothetical protein ACLS7Z_02400 [Christensenellales bacterium]